MATFRKRRGPRGRTVHQVRVLVKGYPAKYRTFDSGPEAHRWAVETEARMRAGTYRDYTPAERTLLHEVLARYEREVLLKQRGGLGSRSNLRALDPSLGNYALASLTPEAVARHRDERLKVVSSQTVRHDLAILRRILNLAMKEWGYYLPYGNPVYQVKLPPQARARTRRLQDGEEEKLLAAAREYGGEIGDFIRLALETGMRRGELARVRWERVQWDVPAITMPEGAPNKPDRVVPLSTRALAVLRGRWEAAGQPSEGRIWLELLAPDSATQAFVRVCARADLEDLRLHDLRHEATSRMFERGLNEMQVAAITGHKTLAMLKRYTHLRPGDLAKMLG